MGASQRPKIGLILEGGGMRAGFVAGLVMALADHGITGFDDALAVSASVPTLAYFVAGQRIEMEKVWRGELNTPKLVRYRNIPAAYLALSVKRPVLDIDYLLNDVFRRRYPLDTNRLRASDTTCSFAVTLAPEGRLEFLEPEDGYIYEIFKAAMAVPGAYPTTVCLCQWGRP
jgi:predicted patatin/cPLA2 family phospholipase